MARIKMAEELLREQPESATVQGEALVGILKGIETIQAMLLTLINMQQTAIELMRTPRPLPEAPSIPIRMPFDIDDDADFGGLPPLPSAPAPVSTDDTAPVLGTGLDHLAGESVEVVADGGAADAVLDRKDKPEKAKVYKGAREDQTKP